MELLPDRSLPWPIIWPAVKEIARSEGCRLNSYRDVAGVWTIGWGETAGVTAHMQWTQEHADRKLRERLAQFATGVKALCTRAPSGLQLGALVSLAYNIGLAGFARSTVLKAHNRGDTQAAARAFALWNKARVNGVLKIIPGLTARRAREAALYLSRAPETRPPLDAIPADYAAETIDMPAAEPESRLHSSPIAQSGAVSIATGTLAAAGAVSHDLRSVADSVGIDPLLVVGAIAIAVGAVVLWQRVKQRREGWS